MRLLIGFDADIPDAVARVVTAGGTPSLNAFLCALGKGDAIVNGLGEHKTVLASEAAAECYRQDRTDEFLKPMVFFEAGRKRVRNGAVSQPLVCDPPGAGKSGAWPIGRCHP